MTDKTTPNRDYLNLGLVLSEKFFKLEGKRPRILIGGTIDPLSKLMKEICNSLADMGYDVDVSPKIKSMKSLVNQSLENDTDVILICSDDCFSIQELMYFQDQILSDQPYIIMSLYSENMDCILNLQGQLDKWTLFNTTHNSYLIGYNLLNHLLGSS